MHPLSQAERDAEIEWFREELAAVNEATIAARAENKAARAQSEAVIRQIEGLIRVRYDPPAPLKEAIVTSILTALFANAIRLAFWPTPIWFFSPLWCAIWLAGEACAEFIRYFFKPKLEDPSSEGFLNRPRILQDFLGGVMRGAFMVLFWGKIEAGNEGTTRFYWTTFAMTMLDSAATLAMALTAYCDQYRSSSGPSSQHTARTKMEESLAVAQV